MVRTVLSVAEKPSISKNITFYLANGKPTSQLRSYSQYNRITKFKGDFRGQQDCNLIITSVTGHIESQEFAPQYKNWRGCDPEVLLDEAQINKTIEESKKNLEKNLETQARTCTDLVLWLDCDREGEAIAFEVIDICYKVNPQLVIYRAKFSSVTKTDIFRAWNNLVQPDEGLANAVKCRQEYDLRVGACFTRFLTMLIQKQFTVKLVSYGPCQFPTLGFIVQRWKEIQDHVSEKFWYIHMALTKNCQIDGRQKKAEFKWDRGGGRLYDREIAAMFYVICTDYSKATIEEVDFKEKKKFKPQPLTTIELQKLGTGKLKWTASKVMDVAEKIYIKGFVSYPRTETNKYSNTMNQKALVENQLFDHVWGQYASDLLGANGQEAQYMAPRGGNKDDQAHPPIHPVKHAQPNQLDQDELKLYELITRHFLASCSKDAIGDETTIYAKIQTERFKCNGQVIRERNYQEIFIYDKWTELTQPVFLEGEELDPSELLLKEGETTAPNYLTEQDQIGLMDKNGIGTDATIAEHIKTVQDRNYVFKQGMYMKPANLGIALVLGFDDIGIQLDKPNLRAAMERDMSLIASGQKDYKETVSHHCQKMKDIYRLVKANRHKLMDSVAKHLGHLRNNDNDGDNGPNPNGPGFGNNNGGDGPEDDNPGPGPDGGNARRPDSPQFEIQKVIMKCKDCKSGSYQVKRAQKTNLAFLGCNAFPVCKGTIFFPYEIKILDITVSDENCPNCSKKNGQSDVKLVDIKFSGVTLDNPLVIMNDNDGGKYCLGGCDKILAQLGYNFEFGGDVNDNTNNNNSRPAYNFGGEKSNTFNALMNVKKQPNAQQKRSNSSGNVDFNNNSYQNNQKCFFCGEQGHTSSNCHKKNNGNNNATNNDNKSTYSDNSNTGYNNKTFKCYKCGEEGHMANQCPNNGQNNGGNNNNTRNQYSNNTNNQQKQEYTCYTCGESGHFSNNCPNKGQNNFGKKENANKGSNFNQEKDNKFTCYSCGEPGHFSNNCPNKDNNRSKTVDVNKNPPKKKGGRKKKD